MSILIKGIDMPKNGEITIAFASDENGENTIALILDANGKPIEHKGVTELPTPHGRLIDADRLLALVEKEVNNTCIGCEPEPDDCCAYDRFEKIISEIKNARTIIEVEE